MSNPVPFKTATGASPAHTDAELSAMAKDDPSRYLLILRSDDLSAGNLARAIDAAQHVNSFEAVESLLISFLDHASLSVREAAVLALVRSTSIDVQIRLRSIIASESEPAVLRVVAEDVLAEIREG